MQTSDAEDTRYVVSLFGEEYEAIGQTRAKATTVAIAKYREDKGDTTTPNAVLRSLSSTRKATLKQAIQEAKVRRLYSD